MTYSLRRRLSKRQARNDLRSSVNEEQSDDRNTSCGFKDAQPLDTTSDSLSQDELSNTPPPPPPKDSPSPTIRRVSPSRSLLSRYKHRSPASSAPSTTAVSPPDLTINHKTGKNSAFSELIDYGTSALSQTVAAMTLSIPRAEDWSLAPSSQPLSKVESSATTKNSSRNGVADSTSTDREAELALRRRSTRSQTRRQQRAASGADNKARNSEDWENPRAVPPGLSVIKRSDDDADSSRIKSPSSHDDNNEKVTARRDSAIPFDSPSVNATPSRTPDAAKVELMSDSPELITLSPSKSPAPEPAVVESFSDHPSAIRVYPPAYDPTCSALHQWCDHRVFSSRSEHPWGWMKKWTCCHCNALTMVEQDTCARISCGHRRCKRDCKVLHR